MLLLAVFAAFSLLLAAQAQTKVNGKCSEHLPFQENFDINKYAGIWYEIERIPNRLESDMTCVWGDYATKTDGHVTVVNTGKLSNGTVRVMNGDAYVPVAGQLSKFVVRFFATAPYAPYWILSTDYQQYSLAYSCKDLPDNMSAFHAWILSRQPTLDKSILANLKRIATSSGLPDTMKPVPQDCPLGFH